MMNGTPSSGGDSAPLKTSSKNPLPHPQRQSREAGSCLGAKRPLPISGAVSHVTATVTTTARSNQ